MTGAAALCLLTFGGAPAAALTTHLTCSGLSCSSSPNPLPNDVYETTAWDPCGGAPFWWYGSIDLEAGYDELVVDGEVFTGATSISGHGVGSVEVSLFTDASVQSAGISLLEAICDDNRTYLEAECPSSPQGSYGTRRTSSSDYSGAGYVESAGNTTNVASSVDRATYDFKTGAGSFHVYFRVNTNGSADDDSWFYRIDGGTWVTMNNYTASGWNWVKKSTPMTLSAGSHSLEVANRENGLKLDKLAVVPASDPTPSGTFGAAYNCSPDVSCGQELCTDGDVCVVADALAQGACMPNGAYPSGGSLGFTSPRYCDSNYDCGSGNRCAMTFQGNAGILYQCVSESFLSDPNVVAVQLCASPTFAPVGICDNGGTCGAPDGLGYSVCTE